MTKKQTDELKAELAKLRERVEALEKRPEYHFHYHPPIFYNPPLSPTWLGPTITWGGHTGTLTNTNRLETSCVN
jgi:hypothetical protein